MKVYRVGWRAIFQPYMDEAETIAMGIDIFLSSSLPRVMDLARRRVPQLAHLPPGVVIDIRWVKEKIDGQRTSEEAGSKARSANRPGPRDGKRGKTSRDYTTRAGQREARKFYGEGWE